MDKRIEINIVMTEDKVRIRISHTDPVREDTIVRSFFGETACELKEGLNNFVDEILQAIE